MFEPIIPESKLHPADHADETLAKEEWLDRFEPAVEDVQNALDWHGETYGNELFEGSAALWFICPDYKEERKERRAKELQDAINDIVMSYAEEVLWPEFKKKERI